MNRATPGTDHADREETLANLVEELTEQCRLGRPPDVDGAAARHPDLADELRELWATAQIAEELARSDGDETLRWETPGGAAGGREPPRTFGDYELLEELGRGGMGVVYRARQTSLGRVVALKMLLRGELASSPDLARFRAEPESAARLDHPHIVPIYAVGEHQGQPYFTMKLVEGTTLARRLADGPLPAREAAALLAPVARAVDFAHRAGVLHRDLKPSNLLIDRQGRPLVGDFGLAKRVDHEAGLTLSGALVGTPSFMAPEQALGDPGRVGPASDVYGLGAILYQMLTGRPPFLAASALDTLLLVREQDPIPPRLLNPKVDRELELIALKCLQKPPGLRYPSAAALADDLEAFLAGEPISIRSTRLTAVAGRLLGETYHAPVLENWGLLWIWHSLVIFVLCVLTNVLQWRGVVSHGPYLLIWTVGLGTWAAIFWALRRRGGPVTFVERQIAHLWAGSVIACTMLYVVEMLMGLPVSTLSPVLALHSGMIFMGKAGILSGKFYIEAGALFLTAAVMALVPSVGISIFGVVSGLCFFVPGLKYYLRRARTGRTA
jgi:serine/threonine-protein kinase